VNAIDFSAPSVTLATGRTITCDLVIAADGLKSKCRELYVGHADPPHNTGDLAYRILIKASDMKKDPGLAQLTEVPVINYWMGPGAHAVCYLLKGGELYNIVLVCPDNLPEGLALQDADLQELRNIFATWDVRLQKLLELVQKTYKWKLQVRYIPSCHPSIKSASTNNGCRTPRKWTPGCTQKANSACSAMPATPRSLT